MPMHDWTRVKAGIFHDFHFSWIAEIKRALNAGLLPPDYYALAEQVSGSFEPDVLTLKFSAGNGDPGPTETHRAAVAVTTPPKVRFVARTELNQYVLKQRSVVIRHSSGDRVVALIEVVSPGNKASRAELRRFIDKAASALALGYHLSLVDAFPPGRHDPQGIHGALWSEVADDSFRAPADKPLTVAAYDAGPPQTAYVEPLAVGDELPSLPVFLLPGEHILLPLEATYQPAWQSVPQRWRNVLESAST